MFGLGKKQKAKDGQTIQKADLKSLAVAIDAGLDNWMQADSTEALLAETGKTRQELLDAVLSDDEVESCREDLRTAIIAEPWRLFALDDADSEVDNSQVVNEVMINRLYKAVRTHASTFADIAILARFGGFAVAEYIYKREADGFITLDSVLSREGELDNYVPKRDGSVIYKGQDNEVVLEQTVKNIVLKSRAVPARPAGELMIVKAYPAVAMRKRGWAYAGQFIARHAQPYIIGKQANDVTTDKESFTTKIFRFLSGGAIGIGKDDDIKIEQLTGNGDAFELLERMANRRIQKLLLGRVKTSELTSGSRASQETDDQTRKDRISAYLDLMSKAIQHAIDAIIVVNNAYGIAINAPQGIWFEYQQQSRPDKELAEVNKIYFDSGKVKPTKAYMVEVVGFEEHHIEMVEDEPKVQTPKAQAFSFSMPHATNFSYQLSTKDKNIPSNSPFTGVGLKETEQKKYEQLMQPKIKALLSACDGSEDWDEFSKKLDEIEFDNTDLITDLTLEMANNFVDGVTGGEFNHD